MKKLMMMILMIISITCIWSASADAKSMYVKKNVSMNVTVGKVKKKIVLKRNTRVEIIKSNKSKKLVKYKQYKGWIKNKSLSFKKTNAFGINITNEDLEYMYRCVETETYDRNSKQKRNVASVILNRVKDNNFDDTPKDVVTARSQFCYFRTNISKSTKSAVKYVIDNGDTTNGSLYFHSNSRTSTFCGARYIFSDGVHHFYR